MTLYLNQQQTLSREESICIKFKKILIEDAKYYVYGLAIFINVQQQSLVALTVNKENILYEEFGPQLLSLNQ